MCFLLMKGAVTLNLFVECDDSKCYHEMISMGFPCWGVNEKHYENWEQSRARQMWSRYRRGARKPLQGEMRFLLPLVLLIGNRWFKNVVEIIFDLYDRAVFLVTWLGMHNILVPYWLLTDVIFKSMINNLMLLNVIFNKSLAYLFVL